jgi:uncharacterized membrane protein
MEMELMDLVGLASRWLHIASAVTLLGGAIFAMRLLVDPGLSEAVGRTAKIFLAAVGGLLVSGLYNFLAKPAFPRGYHMIFGIKFLLALHVFAVAFLVGRPDVAGSKRARQLTGLVISGAIIVALSAYLRFLSS